MRLHPFRIAALVTLLASAVIAAAPVRLAPYPQKFRTFYAADDPAVPPAVRQTGAPASSGITPGHSVAPRRVTLSASTKLTATRMR